MEYEKRTISSMLEWKYSTHTLFMSILNEFKKIDDPKIVDLYDILNKRALDPSLRQDASFIFSFISSIVSIHKLKNTKENYYEKN